MCARPSYTLPLCSCAGDQLLIGKETAKQLGMGTNMYTTELLLAVRGSPLRLSYHHNELNTSISSSAGPCLSYGHIAVPQLHSKLHRLCMLAYLYWCWADSIQLGLPCALRCQIKFWC